MTDPINCSYYELKGFSTAFLTQKKIFHSAEEKGREKYVKNDLLIIKAELPWYVQYCTWLYMGVMAKCKSSTFKLSQ